MSGFRARNMQFVNVKDISFLDEVVIWQLKGRHLLYILFAAFMAAVNWGSTTEFAAMWIAALAIIAAFYPKKSVSFEALAFGAVKYVLTARRRKVAVELAEPERKSTGGGKPEVCVVEFDDREDVAGFATRDAVARKSARVRKV